MSEFYYDDYDDYDDSDEAAVPISEKDTIIIQQFKDTVQKIKSKLYEKNIIINRSIIQTNDKSNLDELHKYETIMLAIGTNLLQGLWGIDDVKMLDITPIILWKIVIDNDLSSDSKILIENEIRSQFIQHPVSRISSDNI